MRSIKISALAAILFLPASLVMAAPPPIVAKGNGPAIACASCHGVDGSGNGQAGYPALAQLPQAYFIKQIADFKSGTRSSPVMTPIAKALNAEDTESAARYYASLPRPPLPTSAVDPAIIERGKILAMNGAWDRGMPACFKCHASGGQGVPPVFPPIAGQHASYTAGQLKAWKSGVRSNDPQKLMKTVADHLSDDEMNAVAAYLATLGSQEKKK